MNGLTSYGFKLLSGYRFLTVYWALIAQNLPSTMEKKTCCSNLDHAELTRLGISCLRTSMEDQASRSSQRNGPKTTQTPVKLC